MSKILITLRKLPFCAAVLSSIAGFSAHAAEPNVHPTAVATSTSTPQVLNMLHEIYATQHPVHFQQIDVSARALMSIPVGTTRSELMEIFRPIASSKIIKDSSESLVVRDDKGRAILDPDARSVIITFFFDKQGKVRSIDAVYLKNQ